MTHHNKTTATQGQADSACGSCPSDQALTEKESSILKEMRSIKEQVGPVAQRLSELEERIKKPVLNETDDTRNAEWAELEGQMTSLREEWKKWQDRLDKAIEQKLICLGHRDPE